MARRRRLIPAQEDTIVSLYNSGLSEEQVSREAGFQVARSTVNIVLKRRGVKRRGDRHGCATREYMPRRWGYSTWQSMIQRCTNRSHSAWDAYGGRGIAVCSRWLDSYSTFISDMGIRPSLGHTIDRIDVDGHYEPGNCRWATNEEQAANKRCSVRVNGRTVQEIAEELGCHVQTVYGRLARGWQRELVASPVKKPRTGCSVEGCLGVHLCKGLCSRHYQRQRAINRGK